MTLVQRSLDTPAPARPAGPGPAQSGPAADHRPLWRRAFARAVLVPFVVLMPLVALAPTADHRFNLYWHGGLFRDDPLRIVPHTLHSLPGYLTLGNFRPLGRMLEKSLDLLAYTLGDLFSVPVTIPFRLVSFAAAAVLTVVAVLLAESVVAPGRLFDRAPSTFAATVPFAAGGGFVAAGSAGPAVLFGGLYLLSAAMVLGVAAAVCRIRRRPRWWGVLLLIGAGAVLAGVNEIVYLALPLATVAVVVRHRIGLRSPAGVRALMSLWLGFLPVFAAIRLVIRGYCTSGECYRGSDVAMGPHALEALPVRAVAWLPPLMWRSATMDGHWSWPVPVLALVVLGLLAGRTVRDAPRLTPVSRPAALGVALVGAAAVLPAAVMGALNADVQTVVLEHRWGQGWRDTAVTATAGALVLAGVLQAVVRRRIAVLVVLLTLSAVVSTAANKSYRDQLGPRAPQRLANQVALEMADFDRSPAGDVRRCALRTEFRTRYASSAFSLKRFDQSLDVAAEQQAGVRFCTHE